MEFIQISTGRTISIHQYWEPSGSALHKQIPAAAPVESNALNPREAISDSAYGATSAAS